MDTDLCECSLTYKTQIEVISKIMARISVERLFTNVAKELLFEAKRAKAKVNAI